MEGLGWREGPGVRKGQQGPSILILLWLEVGRKKTLSNTEQPEEEEDGEKQEEGVLPAGGWVTLSQVHTCGRKESCKRSIQGQEGA